MTDQTTSSPLRVATGVTGPHIRLPFGQLDEVKRLLNSHVIRYRVRENAVSLSGGPFMVELYLEGVTDASVVQRILDSCR
jgi:hypothetical protein